MSEHLEEHRHEERETEEITGFTRHSESAELAEEDLEKVAGGGGTQPTVVNGAVID